MQFLVLILRSLYLVCSPDMEIQAQVIKKNNYKITILVLSSILLVVAVLQASRFLFSGCQVVITN